MSGEMKTMVLTESVLLDAELERNQLDELVNACYNRIVNRAKEADLAIMGVSQSMTMASSSTASVYVMVVIFANVAAREEVERMQRQAQLAGPATNGPRRI